MEFGSCQQKTGVSSRFFSLEGSSKKGIATFAWRKCIPSFLMTEQILFWFTHCSKKSYLFYNWLNMKLLTWTI